MNEAPKTFEEALKALEAVVRELESGDLPLEKALEAYEKGARLKAECEKMLQEAQRRVEKITITDNNKGSE